MYRNDNSNQLILFNQPVEVLVEADCSVQRASELVQCSPTTIYQKIRQSQFYRREVATGIWCVHSTGKKEGSTILVNVTFIFSPLDKYWRLA